MTKAAPKSEQSRVAAYLAQTGRKKLTPKQARRVKHKRNHWLADEVEGY